MTLPFFVYPRHCEGACTRGNPFSKKMGRCHHPYGMGHLPMDSPPR